MISLGGSFGTKYNFVKTATISDVLFDCLHEIKEYLTQPMYQDLDSEPVLKQKIHKTMATMLDLQIYLDTPSASSFDPPLTPEQLSKIHKDKRNR